MMGHLNSFSASGGGNLNKNFPKIQMPGGVARGGDMLKLRFDRYITAPRLQTNKQTLTTLKHSIEFTYSDFPCQTCVDFSLMEE